MIGRVLIGLIVVMLAAAFTYQVRHVHESCDGCGNLRVTRERGALGVGFSSVVLTGRLRLPVEVGHEHDWHGYTTTTHTLLGPRTVAEEPRRFRDGSDEHWDGLALERRLRFEPVELEGGRGKFE